MAEKKSLVEEALIQMKSLEETVAENAKGILHSTMKEEIGQLVKESLGTKKDEEDESTMEGSFNEQEEDEDEVEMDDSEMETDIESDEEDMEMDSEDEMDSEEDMEMDFDSEDEEEPIDLTHASDEEILKVFKGMSEEDGIIVKKDGNTIDLKDGEDEYKISLGESEEEESYDEMEESYHEEDESYEEMEEEEIDQSFGEEGFQELDFDVDSDQGGMDDEELVFEIEIDDSKEEEDESYGVMDDESYEEMEESYDEENEGTDDYSEGDMSVYEGFKPKGVGMGKPSKFKYKKVSGGFKESMKQGTKGVGMGKPKFEYKETKSAGQNKIVKKAETKEASRTLGAGRKFGRRGLPKPKAAPRHLEVESVQSELVALKAKNEEYRKALNVFRDKLNEVAIFNSNLAYATRLFTEHSTTKHEKINILRRFDGVESLKESKTLYKTIKDELSNQNNAKVVKESLQEKFEKTPVSGSSVDLIESKTYENPQFLRMKDLMSKMNIIK